MEENICRESFLSAQASSCCPSLHPCWCLFFLPRSADSYFHIVRGAEDHKLAGKSKQAAYCITQPTTCCIGSDYFTGSIRARTCRIDGYPKPEEMTNIPRYLNQPFAPILVTRTKLENTVLSIQEMTQSAPSPPTPVLVDSVCCILGAVT